MEIIITSGGTKEPIDDVRYIANTSSGRLGARVAEEAAARGHIVQFVHARGSALPRRRGAMSLWPFTTSQELKRHLKELIPKAAVPAAVVHAAAVADFLPFRSKGKLASNAPELVLRLRRAEKIVDRIKKWNPQILLVKFKLESGCTEEELIAAGRKAMVSSKADLLVANDARKITARKHPALILRSDGTGLEARGKPDIARKLLDQLEADAIALRKRGL